MKKYFIFFILIYLFSSLYVSAAETTSTGFIPGQIWYSKDAIVEGDTVNIYTAVWNNASSSLSAKVEFYDQNVILGTRDVIVAPQELKEVSVSWKVTAGDHVISAKIISPSITVSGKKQTITVNNTLTETSRKFIPVVIKTINGDPATGSDIIKNQIDKATSGIEGILPDSVSSPITKNLDVVSAFREETYASISKMKDETKKTIEALSAKEKAETPSTTKTNTNTKPTTTVKTSTDDAMKKPIAYVKLFFLSILSFIFGSKLVFYALCIFIVFLIIRWIYNRLRNR
ncbi:hypothetical protein HXX01_02985 [Candidatus Nomurabacteria bacterium]|nr:hypothetical protein [Candidatus Nomurabacteria bacterium]